MFSFSEVPQLGPQGVAILKANGISTTHALFGKFLMLKEEGVGCVELTDRFWFWLESIGYPAGFRSAIVHAVAAKLDMTIPGLYDISAFDEN